MTCMFYGDVENKALVVHTKMPSFSDGFTSVTTVASKTPPTPSPVKTSRVPSPSVIVAKVKPKVSEVPKEVSDEGEISDDDDEDLASLGNNEIESLLEKKQRELQKLAKTEKEILRSSPSSSSDRARTRRDSSSQQSNISQIEIKNEKYWGRETRKSTRMNKGQSASKRPASRTPERDKTSKRRRDDKDKDMSSPSEISAILKGSLVPCGSIKSRLGTKEPGKPRPRQVCCPNFNTLCIFPYFRASYILGK